MPRAPIADQKHQFDKDEESFIRLHAKLVKGLRSEGKASLQEIKDVYQELHGHYQSILELIEEIVTSLKESGDVDPMAKYNARFAELTELYEAVSTGVTNYTPTEEDGSDGEAERKQEEDLLKNKELIDAEITKLSDALDKAKNNRQTLHRRIMDETFKILTTNGKKDKKDRAWDSTRGLGGATPRTTGRTSAGFEPGYTSTPGEGRGDAPEGYQPRRPATRAAGAGWDDSEFSHADPFRFEGHGRSGGNWWASQNQFPADQVNPQDYSRVLARIPTPQFKGAARSYETWKATFDGLMDQVGAPDHVKLLHLRACLKDEPLNALELMGHSDIAYRMARERLERMYGGVQRPINIRMEELTSFRGVREGNARDIETLAALTENLIIGYSDAGQAHEMGGGTLFWLIQHKMNEPLLNRYKWWLLQNHSVGNVNNLREFINQEAVMTAANSEMIKGSLSAKETGRGFRRGASRPQTMMGTSDGGRNAGRGSYAKQGHNRPSGTDNKCKHCEGDHFVSRCSKFRALDPKERWQRAKDLYLCFRCLSSEHKGNECTRSKQCGVDECRATHHFLLHDVKGRSEYLAGKNARQGKSDKPPDRETKKDKSEKGNTNLAVAEDDDPPTYHASDAYHTNNKDYIVLRTLPVIIRSGNKAMRVNALLDDGSTLSYLNQSAANQLGLTGEESVFTVRVLNDKRTRFTTQEVDFTVESLDGKIKQNMTAQTVTRVTGNLHVLDWNQYKSKWNHLRKINFPLANKRPVVDILLGLNVHNLHNCEIPEVRGQSGEPVARLTPLGWTCVGVPELTTQQQNTHLSFHIVSNYELNQGMQKFWEMEEPTTITEIVRPEEQLAEKLTDASLTFKNGKYTVGVPWRTGSHDLKNNYRMALRRLEGIERKLLKTPAHAEGYKKVFSEYERKGYIKEVPVLKEIDKDVCHYIPHFAVIKEDRTTTKLRVVFDASARFNNTSLNEQALPGPKLQRDLVQVLTRFRRHMIGIISDIQEMYMQIGLHPDDRCVHRFLWREMKLGEAPRAFEFWSQMFGVGSSPYIAQKVTRKHATDNEKKWPRAAETIKLSTYMDDSMDSVDSVKAACQLYKDLCEFWKSMSMHARKWASNSSELLKIIPPGECAAEVDLTKDQLPSQKTLGVWWIAKEDVFTFRVEDKTLPEELTKRYFLSRVASLYDPLGFVSPVVIQAKMLMQELWAEGADWDEPGSEYLQEKMRKWFEQLQGLQQVKVHRVLQPMSDIKTRELHTFVDASEKAFGCAAYLRCEDTTGAVTIRFVISKSRVAPVTSVSIPRLELMGSVLGLRTAETMAAALGLSKEQCHYWCDSADVIYWIHGYSRDFKPFVANRVGEIQRRSEPENWRHVPTDQNPADIVSRGMEAEQLARSVLWWEGPEFLYLQKEKWPKRKETETKTAHSEKKRKAENYHAIGKSDTKVEWHEVNLKDAGIDLTRFNQWEKHVRIIATCLYWKIRKPSKAEQYQVAEDRLIMGIQQEEFKQEIKQMKAGSEQNNLSNLQALKPWIAEDGIVRGNTRLSNSECVPWGVMYPILLPRTGHGTQLIVDQAHRQCGHGGVNSTYAQLQQRYWVLRGKEAVKENDRSCLRCRRMKVKPITPQMAPLPDYRTTVTKRAFEQVSLDYAGPFMTTHGRGKAHTKRYLCLLACMQTRAVHLEMASDLGTDSFMNAFMRFTSRRGVPSLIVSDNGSNFVSAFRELQEVVREINYTAVQERTRELGVVWKFNPPYAPHFNGVHETLIKAAKRAMHKIWNQAHVTDDELQTVMIQAEGLLNGRPITSVSTDPKDEAALTPNHFLVGRVELPLLAEEIDSLDFNPNLRWRRVQELTNHFWKRWMAEWVPALSPRAKWRKELPQLQVGELVLEVDKDVPRGKWHLGRVRAVHPGPDGHVRTVTIFIRGKELVRPVVKLCPLELSEKVPKIKEKSEQ